MSTGHIGHLLAAAGSVEAIATVAAIRDAKLPANLNLTDCDGGEGIDILKEVKDWTNPRTAVVNSFGFGGTNASLVLTEFKE